MRVPDPSDVLFFISRSLWNRVTPGLRGVSYLLSEASLNVRWMYEDAPGEWVREVVHEAETECIADLWQSHEVAYLAEHLPLPEPRGVALQAGERWVYLRYEASSAYPQTF